MIVTVTLNAALDRTLSVPNFRLGRRHRAVDSTTMAGGKGVNVARALKTLGQPVIATGVAGGQTGTRLIEQLTGEAILNDFVRIQGESRTSTAVIDPTSGAQTEINERGPSVAEAELELFVDKLLYLAKGAGVVVICGSLPAGVPVETYARLVKELKATGVTTVVDSEGEPLRLATRAEPEVVTPNVLEAEELVGHEFSDYEDDLPAAAREVVDMGAREAIVTHETGCVAVVSEEGERRLCRVTIDPTHVDVSSGVGSGDAFLAGYVASRYTGSPAEECLRFAVACGAESVQHFGAGVIDPREAERLMGHVSLEPLPEPALHAS
ncbi:MAG TPA: 1-phosphofructokinase family hexose kinase [Thermoleophilaceae bacterium]|jgi:1-phosphofructokinase/tagatose 6-phosphate kinase